MLNFSIDYLSTFLTSLPLNTITSFNISVIFLSLDSLSYFCFSISSIASFIQAYIVLVLFLLFLNFMIIPIGVIYWGISITSCLPQLLSRLDFTLYLSLSYTMIPSTNALYTVYSSLPKTSN